MPTKKQIMEALTGPADLVEAGFFSLVLKNAPPDPPERVVNMLRIAFFYGARHMMDVMLMAQELDDDNVEKVAEKVRAEFHKFDLTAMDATRASSH